LGKVLVHKSQEGVTSGRIVEVEAYIGPDDPASHAYKNRKTARTTVQYGKRGLAYIYQIYGKQCCFNIVTGKEGKPEVILIRALDPIGGIDLMMKRRGISTTRNIKNLTNGPAKLCQAMGIDKSLYGEELFGKKLYIVEDEIRIKKEEILATPRINIDYAGNAKNKLWRFIIKNNPFVSKR
jgi:DNA-3-methyladenine glycosylase